MTTRPPRPELRHAVLAKLSAHTAEVEWAGTAAHLAYADAVIAWADWLATTDPPPPALRGPTSTPAGREAAQRLYQQIRNATTEGEQ